MEKEEKFCYKCGQGLSLYNDEDCWSTSFHVPFDTLLKIKALVKDHCLCEKCLGDLKRKIETKHIK